MKTVKIKLVGANSKIKPLLSVDGQYQKLKKNSYGSYQTNYSTEKDEIVVSVYRELELKSKLWWLYSFISFVISIFGIFEPWYDKKCISIKAQFKFKLNETNDIKLRYNPLKQQGRVLEIETQNEFEEIENEYFVDKQAKTRKRINTLFKVVVWIAIIIALIVYLRKAF